MSCKLLLALGSLLLRSLFGFGHHSLSVGRSRYVDEVTVANFIGVVQRRDCHRIFAAMEIFGNGEYVLPTRTLPIVAFITPALSAGNAFGDRVGYLVSFSLQCYLHVSCWRIEPIDLQGVSGMLHNFAFVVSAGRFSDI